MTLTHTARQSTGLSLSDNLSEFSLGLQELEVKGDLSLKLSDPNLAQIIVHLQQVGLIALLHSRRAHVYRICLLGALVKWLWLEMVRDVTGQHFGVPIQDAPKHRQEPVRLTLSACAQGSVQAVPDRQRPRHSEVAHANQG